MQPCYKLGWRKEFSDKRDLPYVPQSTIPTEPVEFTLAWVPQATNQGPVGSCVGNAVCTAVHANLIKQKAETFLPSRLFSYYNARLRQGWQDLDSGAYIRDAIKSAVQEGVPKESDWPYDTRRLTEQPPQDVYTKALQHRGWLYRRIGGGNTIQDIKAFLMTEQLPVIFGFVLYDSFDWDNGIIELPSAGESVLGGHAAIIYGFNNETRRFKWQSSWGLSWATNGRASMTYDYFSDGWLASDIWGITAVSSPES